MCLESYEFTFAIEFHDQHIEIAGVGYIHELINPCFEYFYLTLIELMEGKILIRFALDVESRKTLSGYDIAFESADLPFV